MKKNDDKIDFVMIWVDGNDKVWQKEKERFNIKKDEDSRDIRYRDWEILKYWFRGVEKFAPWVNKIHFVTCGHLPDWINKENPKLNIVKHSDYIPNEYLPTFSSHPIELNLHRIKDLSEHFVYFNDDTFIINDVKKNDFFFNGLPCDMAVINATMAREKLYRSVMDNDMLIINSRFNKRNVICNNISKWINFRYGRLLIRTLFGLPWPAFIGLYNKHMCNSFLKSTFEEVWDKEFEKLDQTCMHKFRDYEDVNQNLFEFWQLVSGNFYPKKIKSRLFQGLEEKENLIKAIRLKRYKLICINDSDYNNENFEKVKREIQLSFETILPDKSSFEK